MHADVPVVVTQPLDYVSPDELAEAVATGDAAVSAAAESGDAEVLATAKAYAEQQVAALPAPRPAADGLSAYEIAVAAGFVGTRDQWLSSLKGPKGDAGSGSGSRPGELSFASFGSFAAVESWMAGKGSSGSREEVKWHTGDFTMDAQLGLWSGHRLKGTDLPSREYGTGTRWRAKSGAGSFFGKRQNSQGYPSDGSVRDLTVSGIEFYGNTPVLPANDLSGTYSGNTQWYTEFRDCGFVGAQLMTGWGDGFHVTGNTHVQAITDTWVTCGGSENSLFTGDGISFLDSAVMGAGKPFIRMFSDMWTVGNAMISARGNCYQLLVSGGGNGRVIGTYFDAPASQRTALPQVNVTGGKALTITNASFHNGTVGIQAAGGSGVVIVQGNVFNDETDSPLVCQSGFTGVVKWGFNAYTGSTPKVLKVNSLSQVICDDPQVTIQNLSGSTLRAATA